MYVPSHPHRAGKRLTHILQHRSLLLLAMAVLLLMTTWPAWASTPCPAAFGPKDPMVNVLGWCVVALGVALGCALLGVCIHRSRRLRRPARVAVVTGGVMAMLVVWITGFALAFSAFFFTC